MVLILHTLLDLGSTPSRMCQCRCSNPYLNSVCSEYKEVLPSNLLQGCGDGYNELIDNYGRALHNLNRFIRPQNIKIRNTAGPVIYTPFPYLKMIYGQDYVNVFYTFAETTFTFS
jgi:hypothetical protein